VPYELPLRSSSKRWIVCTLTEFWRQMVVLDHILWKCLMIHGALGLE
jgi:hypothetical protein